MTDVVGAVMALSATPPARLTQQMVTNDDALIQVWEQARDEDQEPPPVPSSLSEDHRLCSWLANFDLEEESTIPAGRHTDVLTVSLEESINVVSVKVLASDAGFPVSLYGSVFVRDTLDNRRVYLFRRDRDNPQLINSPGETLLLTGPSCGLFVVDRLLFEIDLRLRMRQQVDEQQVHDAVGFSRGTTEYDNVNSTQPNVVSEELTTLLSTIELNYTMVRRAVEAYVEVKVINAQATNQLSTENVDGKLRGRITACIARMPEEMVLFDGSLVAVGDDGMLELQRRVVCVPIWDSLSLRLETGEEDDDDDGELRRVDMTFSPVLCGEESKRVTWCGYLMQIGVFWSALYIQKVDEELLEGNACWGRTPPQPRA